ncbi:MAG: endolytic transglycosylase MltG [Firmicutes bacterium]|nr:endolytic transglycosylase MltG [Bacillota bacterium]
MKDAEKYGAGNAKGEKIMRNEGKRTSKKLILIVVILLIIAIACGSIAIYASNIGKPFNEKDTQMVSVVIEPGSTTIDIGNALVEKGIIAGADQFKLWSRMKKYDSQYKAGTYSLSPSMSFEQIAEILVGGKVDTFSFTIPEGYTIKQVAKTLGEQGFDEKRFLELAGGKDFDEEFPFLKGAQDNENHLEGYLLPNTYTLAAGSDEEDIIRVMLSQFEKDVLPLYDQAGDSGRSLNDYIIAASIIEREAMMDEERPLVASVIYNRLKLEMPLQMCSTVQYILGEPKAVLSNADTQIESPYNTYLNPGLPPGPICSPGVASIDAAMNPAETDYLYFVLSEKLDGTSNFSSDYNQFLRDKDAYYRAYEAAN